VSIQAWGLVLSCALCVGAIAAALMARRETHRVKASERLSLGDRAEIASMVSHELRGPVATIRGLASTTTINYDRLNDAERLEFLGLIDQESLRLLAVVDQTSIAMKLDAGTPSFRIKPAPVRELVDAAVSKTDLRGRRLEMEVPQDLSANCDAKWTGVVLMQLLDNAAKFSPPDAPIEVSARRETDRVVIEVRDHGPGIPEGERAALFTKFARWRPAGYEQQLGSGLGLFICKALLAEQLGEVVITDAHGGGSILRVRLPAREGSLGG
jgi:two-component system sensor histidine kinase KdpD